MKTPLARKPLFLPVRRSRSTWARGQTVVVWNQNRLAGAAHGARVKVTSLTVG